MLLRFVFDFVVNIFAILSRRRSSDPARSWSFIVDVFQRCRHGLFDNDNLSIEFDSRHYHCCPECLDDTQRLGAQRAHRVVKQLCSTIHEPC